MQARPRTAFSSATLSRPGDWLSWLGGLVLALSSFMGWYSISDDGLILSVLGWHTGVLGKLVFFVGLAVVALVALHATGVELPPTIPAGMVLAGLGALGTIFALVRLLSIPDDYAGAGRSIGLWISLLAAVLVIAAGLLRSADEAGPR